MMAAVRRLHQPHCAAVGFGMMIGTGAILPCNLAFVADQFNPKTDSGKRGIDNFFNWYFFTLTFAQMESVTLVVSAGRSASPSPSSSCSSRASSSSSELRFTSSSPKTTSF